MDDMSRWVRFTWADNGGVIRGQAVHVDLLGDARDNGVPIAMGVQGVPAHEDVPQEAAGIGPVGQVWVRPDEATARYLPWWPACTAMFADMYVAQGTPWSCCPRHALRRMIDELDAMGFTMQCAFEPEFILLKDDGDGVLHAPSHWKFATVHGLNAAHAFLEELAETLEVQGVAVEAALKESASGQYEMPLLHADPLAAADHHLIFRETLPVVAREFGFISTVLPKVFPDEAGNGAHLHFSLWRDGVDVMGADDGEALSPHGESFLAGVLEHLPGLCALTAPTAMSAMRIAPGCWSGGYQCWGWDNREAPVRVPSRRLGQAPTNVEYRACDSTCNPYLALAGVLAAGMDGLRRELTPPDPVQVDPSVLSIRPPEMPSSPAEALDHLEADTVLCDALGEPLRHAYVAVRQAEWSAMQQWNLERLVSEMARTY